MNWEHLWIVLGLAGMVAGIFLLGWASAIVWREWQDDKALRAAEARQERHTHRKGDRQETVLLELPKREEPPWRFAGESPNAHWRFKGESEQGWAAESAEYELLTQTAEQPAMPGVDSPSDFEQSMTERVNAMIAAWAEQGNFDRHTMHEVG